MVFLKGASINSILFQIDELDAHIVTMGIACLVAGVILRILATVAIAFGDKLNLKEKVFVALSWMAKATVQAALGPVCLKRLAETNDNSEADHKYAETILMICVLSIVLTAPIGAILISVSGTKLLTKTKPLHVVEGMFSTYQFNKYTTIFDIKFL